MSSKKRKLFQLSAYRLSPKHNDFFENSYLTQFYPLLTKPLFFEDFRWFVKTKCYRMSILKKYQILFLAKIVNKYVIASLRPCRECTRVFSQALHACLRANQLFTRTLHTHMLHACVLHAASPNTSYFGFNCGFFDRQGRRKKQTKNDQGR